MDVFIGTILPVAFNFAPRGWEKCEGQEISIAQNTALYSLLGTMYGGDGIRTFKLPNLNGAVLRGTGTSPQFGDIGNITYDREPIHTQKRVRFVLQQNRFTL